MGYYLALHTYVVPIYKEVNIINGHIYIQEKTWSHLAFYIQVIVPMR